MQHLAILARPSGAADRSALAIAGDDADGQGGRAAWPSTRSATTPSTSARSREGWRTQRDTAAYGSIYAVDESDWTRGAKPANRDAVAAAALRARRYRDA